METTPPVHPGELLKEEFMVPYQLSATRLAQAIGIPTNRITEIINGTRDITADTAILLGHAFRMTPQFWLNAQAHYNLVVATMNAREDRIRRADELANELYAAAD